MHGDENDKKTIRSEQIERVGVLLAAGAGANDSLDGITMLRQAIRAGAEGDMGDITLSPCAGTSEIVQLLLAAGADPNKGSFTPLMMAAMTGNAAVVKILIDVGANVNAVDDRSGQLSRSGRTVLSYAGGRAHELVREILKNAGAKY
ncbi:MAG: ankyrin repeat domain-containing protein [Planctomycetota bacterium]|nr:ankyrin repeat domain-containing protein [Planctomycetota bacterium]